METFFRTLIFVTAMFLVAGTPAIVVAWRTNRRVIASRFTWTAIGAGAFFGVAAVSSDRLVRECGRSGSIACLDVGYQGLLLLTVVVYFTISLIMANSMARR